MEVAFILKLNLPDDQPGTLSAAAERTIENCEGSDDVISCVPWSRDATQMVGQLMGADRMPMKVNTISDLSK